MELITARAVSARRLAPRAEMTIEDPDHVVARHGLGWDVADGWQHILAEHVPVVALSAGTERIALVQALGSEVCEGQGFSVGGLLRDRVSALPDQRPQPLRLAKRLRQGDFIEPADLQLAALSPLADLSIVMEVPGGRAARQDVQHEPTCSLDAILGDRAPLAAFTAFWIALVFAANRRSLRVSLAIRCLANLAHIWPKKLGFQGMGRD